MSQTDTSASDSLVPVSVQALAALTAQNLSDEGRCQWVCAAVEKAPDKIYDAIVQSVQECGQEALAAICRHQNMSMFIASLGQSKVQKPSLGSQPAVLDVAVQWQRVFGLFNSPGWSEQVQRQCTDESIKMAFKERPLLVALYESALGICDPQVQKHSALLEPWVKQWLEIQKQRLQLRESGLAAKMTGGSSDGYLQFECIQLYKKGFEWLVNGQTVGQLEHSNDVSKGLVGVMHKARAALDNKALQLVHISLLYQYPQHHALLAGQLPTIEPSMVQLFCAPNSVGVDKSNIAKTCEFAQVLIEQKVCSMDCLLEVAKENIDSRSKGGVWHLCEQWGQAVQSFIEGYTIKQQVPEQKEQKSKKQKLL